MIREIEEAIHPLVREGLLKNSYLMLVNPHVREDLNPVEWLELHKIENIGTASEKEELANSQTLYFLQLFPAGELNELVGSMSLHGKAPHEIIAELEELPDFIAGCLQTQPN